MTTSSMEDQAYGLKTFACPKTFLFGKTWSNFYGKILSRIIRFCVKKTCERQSKEKFLRKSLHPLLCQGYLVIS